MKVNFSFSYIKNFSLLIINSNYKSTGMYLFLNILFIIFFLILVFLTTKFIGKYFRKKMVVDREIKVIDKLVLGFDKTLLLVEVKGKVYFLHYDKNGFSVIDKVKNNLDSEKVYEEYIEKK